LGENVAGRREWDGAPLRPTWERDHRRRGNGVDARSCPRRVPRDVDGRCRRGPFCEMFDARSARCRRPAVRGGSGRGNLSRPVSRILCDRLRGPAIIPLGRRLPAGSSDLYPEALGEQPASLFGLAPGGVYRASAVTGRSGELLPHRFTLTGAKLRRSVLCGTFPASRRAVVIGHPALWSPDFPPAPLRWSAGDCPAGSSSGREHNTGGRNANHRKAIPFMWLHFAHNACELHA
jgi:hypothetical protein